MLLPARSLADATLGWLFQVWDEVCTDMEHVEQIVAPVQPPAAQAALHAAITNDFTSVRDELTRRLELARAFAHPNVGHDGAILPLPPQAIQALHNLVIPPD
jgi:N-acetyl-beta-hexosaminidase